MHSETEDQREPDATADTEPVVARPSQAPPDVSLHLRSFGDWLVVLIEGEMDLQVVPLMADLRGHGAAQVVFDLSGVTFMDATGLGALVGAAERSARAGGCMRVVIPPRVRALLVLTRCRGMFEIFDSLSEAVSTPVPARPDQAPGAR